MRTSLYEKLFIDGFMKPSYVVATLVFDRLPDEDALSASILATLPRHPRLRSLVRKRWNIPVAFEPRPAREWLERAGVRVEVARDLHALEERLLSAPCDLTRRMPLEVVLVPAQRALVVKMHHAVVDASSGFALLRDFAGRPAPPPRRGTPLHRRALDWARRAQLRPRLPAVSLLASYTPTADLEREPVSYVERVVPGGFARATVAARKRGATFSEHAVSALLGALARYNAARSATPPVEVGLMFAKARPRARSDEAGFRADTHVINAPAARAPHDPATLADIRAAFRSTKHNDLALATLYLSRKIRPPARARARQDSIHLTVSDLTGFGRMLPPSVCDVRVLASPTSFDHAGVLIHRAGDDLRLSFVSHRGAADGDELLGAMLDLMAEGDA